jgi:dynein heavy chain 2
MGQGQMQIALDLLKKCSTQGSWLCLKNLHLVTPWLTTLEKVIFIIIFYNVNFLFFSIRN